jgi:hypothetical protein
VLRRIEADERANDARHAPAVEQSDPIVPALPESDFDAFRLPPEHPSWVRDAIALSSRARELVAKLKPAIVAVLCVWDHRFRSIVVAGRRLHVDASGSYRSD